MKLAFVFGVVTLTGIGAARADSPIPELAPVAPEVAPASTFKNALPAIPDFTIPAIDGDVHTPRELHLEGHAVAHFQLVVRGYVLWSQQGTLWLGDAKDTPIDRGLRVIEVPAKVGAKIGDHVAITGAFEYAAKGTSERTGLLVFTSLAPAKAAKPGAAPRVPVEAPDAPVTAAPVPPAAPVELAARNTSVRELNACSAATLQGKLDDALAACKRAVDGWAGNHVAWYTLGIVATLAPRSAHLAGTSASDAFARAVALRPDAPQYHLALGTARYDALVAGALDRRALDLEPARAELALANAANPNLWRAHYYLGRIARDRGQPRRAAGEFARAIELEPREVGPHVALAELYRAWGFADAAIAVAQQGTLLATKPAAQLAEAWFALGEAQVDRHADGVAIATFDRAVELGHAPRALAARAFARVRMGDFANAKPDLEAYLATPPAADDAADALWRQVATKWLADITTKKR